MKKLIILMSLFSFEALATCTQTEEEITCQNDKEKRKLSTYLFSGPIEINPQKEAVNISGSAGTGHYLYSFCLT